MSKKEVGIVTKVYVEYVFFKYQETVKYEILWFPTFLRARSAQ